MALDADLGWATFDTLTRMRPASGRTKPQVHIWMNETSAGADRLIQVYGSERHLIGDLKASVAQGLRCFVTSNWT